MKCRFNIFEVFSYIKKTLLISITWIIGIQNKSWYKKNKSWYKNRLISENHFENECVIFFLSWIGISYIKNYFLISKYIYFNSKKLYFLILENIPKNNKTAFHLLYIITVWYNTAAVADYYPTNANYCRRHIKTKGEG